MHLLKIILISVLIPISLNAYCYYVECMPTTKAHIATTKENLAKEFAETDKKLSSLQNKIDQYHQVLEKNNELIDKIKILKIEYLKTLKEIEHCKNIEVQTK